MANKTTHRLHLKHAYQAQKGVVQQGELESAIRRALNIFDDWCEVTGFVTPHTSHYYELQGVIRDAVHCGAQQALGDVRPLDSEKP